MVLNRIPTVPVHPVRIWGRKQPVRLIMVLSPRITPGRIHIVLAGQQIVQVGTNTRVLDHMRILIELHSFLTVIPRFQSQTHQLYHRNLAQVRAVYQGRHHQMEHIPTHCLVLPHLQGHTHILSVLVPMHTLWRWVHMDTPSPLTLLVTRKTPSKTSHLTIL